MIYNTINASEYYSEAMFLIPVRLDVCEIPVELKNIQYINFEEDNLVSKVYRAI